MGAGGLNKEKYDEFSALNVFSLCVFVFFFLLFLIILKVPALIFWGVPALACTRGQLRFEKTNRATSALASDSEMPASSAHSSHHSAAAAAAAAACIGSMSIGKTSVHD